MTDSDVDAMLVCQVRRSLSAYVGTESQIISKEVYEKVEQSKFIPVVCEFAEDGSPFLPAFFGSRIGIDFSTPEAVNENWERLIRVLFGKPAIVKPALGKPPSYLEEDSTIPASPARAKFETLRQAILQNRPGINLHRSDFIDACFDFAERLRIREQPDPEYFASKVLDDASALSKIRDHLVDWVLLESTVDRSENFSESLIDVLERLRAMRSKPEGVMQWNDSWFEAHRFFVYETFLYIVAALLRSGAYSELHEIFTAHYLVPTSEGWRHDQPFERFDCFYHNSETLNVALSPQGGTKYLSPAAELVKRQANRKDVPFKELMQADLLILMAAICTPDIRWYPQTLHYSEWNVEYPFFVRAMQRKYFKKLATVLGVKDGESLRANAKEGLNRLHVNNWYNFPLRHSLWEVMRLDQLDTL